MDQVLQDYQRYFNRLNDFFPPILYNFLGLVSGVVMLWHSLDQMADQFQATFNDNSPQKFDYIVVGGGSSGALVAARLAQYYKVLLLEAGGEPNPLAYVPALTETLLNQPYIDWQFKTVPQESACLAMKSHQCAWFHGKGLGGSTNLNSMAYIRGHYKDYEEWVQRVGNDRYSFENLLPYFRRSVEELRIAYSSFEDMSKFFLKAGEEAGYRVLEDVSGKFSEGFGRVPYVQNANGRRLNNFQAFIQKSNPNLTVFKYAEAIRILFDEETKAATGLVYIRHGLSKIVYAKKEVVVSAGAMNSAKLLMLSGIGPEEHLDYLNISVISNRPVGKNLQGHVGTFIGPFILNDTVSMNVDRDVNTETIHEFAINGTGPLSSTGSQSAGFIVSSLGLGNQTWPDVQFTLVGNAVNKKRPKDLSNAYNVKEGVLDKFLDLATEEKDSFQILVLLSRPRSRGRVELQSASPSDEALIDPKFFEDAMDAKVLIEGIKRAVKMIETSKTFRQLGATLLGTPFPGCQVHRFRSDQYWDCYIRHYTVTAHSAAGTCAMGDGDSGAAVVDSKMRVIGVQNLRVVDAAVMPNIVSTDTFAASLMLGELGAELILASAKSH